MIVHSSLLTLT